MWNMFRTPHSGTMKSRPAKQLPFEPQLLQQLVTNGDQTQTAQGYLKDHNFLHGVQRLNLRDQQNLDNARSSINRDQSHCPEHTAKISGAASAAIQQGYVTAGRSSQPRRSLAAEVVQLPACLNSIVSSLLLKWLSIPTLRTVSRSVVVAVALSD
jgi:hypothetical protein